MVNKTRTERKAVFATLRRAKPSSLRYAAPSRLRYATPRQGITLPRLVGGVNNRSSVFQQVLAESDRDRLGAVGGTELLEEGDDMVTDRRRVDAD